MKWAVRIVLILAVAIAGVFVWAQSRHIPYGFKTSPMAWVDHWRSSRAWNAIDYDETDAQVQAAILAWEQIPETPRHMARLQIGPRERWADRRWDGVFVSQAIDGPEISLLFTYPLDRAYEPTRDLDTRAVFGPLLNCTPATWEIEAATSIDLDAWTDAGTPPRELLDRAQAGDLAAQYDLGLGATYLADEALAAELAPWLERAADAGHRQAMEVLGAVLISDPYRDELPNEQGLAYLEAAIAQGSIMAMSTAAYASPRAGEDLYAFAERRLDWEIEAALACEADAMFRIGWRLVTGRGLPKDHDLGLDIAVLAQNGPEIFDRVEGTRLTEDLSGSTPSTPGSPGSTRPMTDPINTADEFGFTEALFSALNASFEDHAARLPPPQFEAQRQAQMLWQTRFGHPGATSDQIDQFESETGLRLPPDLRWLVQNTHDPGGAFFGWIEDPAIITDSMDWVRQGIELDLQHNGTWLEAWGEPPSDIEARKAIFATDFETWPKLIPIMGHRFIRIEPVQSGQPVYSIMQSDVIYYGPNLADWLRAEFLGENVWSSDGSDRLPNDSAWDSFARAEGVLDDIEGTQAAMLERAIERARQTADDRDLP